MVELMVTVTPYPLNATGHKHLFETGNVVYMPCLTNLTGSNRQNPEARVIDIDLINNYHQSHTKEDSMFELTKAAKEQLDMHFAGKEVSPIRVYMAAG